MSGFEVIGVVLGVYPVVLNACQLYKATKSGEGIEKLIQRLKTERMVYDDIVNKLLRPNVEERQLARLKASTNGKDLGCWDDYDLQARLKERLGFEKAQHIISIIKDLNELLESIQKDLPGVARTFEKQRSKFRYGFRNLRNNLPDSSSKAQLDQLREYNESLLRLLSTDKVSPFLEESSRQPLPSLDLPVRDYSHVKHIYSAICNGYHCDCYLPHFANIELPQISPGTSPGASQNDTQRLRLLFPIENTNSLLAADSLVGFQQANEAQPPPPYAPLKQVTSNSSTTTISSRKSRALSICECIEDNNEIPDLCNLVKSLSDSNSTTNVSGKDMGILSSEQKKYKLQLPQEPREMISLDEVTNFESKPRLPRGDRIKLAVTLTYAILQYYSTGWIDQGWTWKDFSVTSKDSKTSDLSQLFVGQRFYSASGQAAKPTSWRGWEPLGEPILTRLGFALIELAMGQRLKDMQDATIDPNMDSDAQDYYTALRLLDTGRIMREEGKIFERVVKACIKHQFTDSHYGKKYLDSQEETFHKDMEQCVLKPLHCMWKEPWGRSQRQLCC